MVEIRPASSSPLMLALVLAGLPSWGGPVSGGSA
ncbi:hypothetical protein PC129_g25283 [Phytophthora cactorum]|uniref:Uncharacterized protein n=1 Tax=Phytophthora cactorum TaxID=29920 RepID=A0A8T0XTL9_9STRA|nr:hypothetical protein Pcac1_g28538 [Phytophthora cactorum]KAG2793158.1 hypothetical protein PC113_g25575 [Phytophthora cactorum]KAG2800474.1 hypothetical protein PC111_g19953 [Phytophthora cactorum]KAG2801071.1 hypothetical protein PC112_g20198 [Phytophthora cactorum]KAG2879495.1 hypothetical protein PC114_g22549 [Phytophthora cactorum]